MAADNWRLIPIGTAEDTTVERSTQFFSGARIRTKRTSTNLAEDRETRHNFGWFHFRLLFLRLTKLPTETELAWPITYKNLNTLLLFSSSLSSHQWRNQNNLCPVRLQLFRFVYFNFQNPQNLCFDVGACFKCSPHFKYIYIFYLEFANLIKLFYITV